jgi:hypothetical protein
VEINLSQAEADALLHMEKQAATEEAFDYPYHGGAIQIPLQSPDKREQFILDVSRSQLNLSKGTYQNRGRNIIILARLDFGGQPHRNPDDTEVPSPHLHLYREGFADKWAFPVPTDFAHVSDPWTTLLDFMNYCHITMLPMIHKGLFT